jgi:hypothetical protein
MDSVHIAQEIFICEVPEVGKALICTTRQHDRRWRCSVERDFPFEDVIFVDISLATAGLEDCDKTLMAPKLHLRAEFIKIFTAGVRTCVRIEVSVIFGSDKNIQGPCT